MSVHQDRKIYDGGFAKQKKWTIKTLQKPKKKNYLKGWIVLHCQQIAKLNLTSISFEQFLQTRGICLDLACSLLIILSISYNAMESNLITSDTFFFMYRMNESKPLDKFSRSDRSERFTIRGLRILILSSKKCMASYPIQRS